MSTPLPPPPRNVTDTREMYTWLYRLYAYVVGSTGGLVLDSEAVLSAASSAAIALSAEQQKAIQDAKLLGRPSQDAEVSKQLQDVQLAQLQSRVSELQKQVDALILYATRPQVDDKIQDAVLMSGVRKI
jgi:hypothetical protein